jgi:hypothetical protein
MTRLDWSRARTRSKLQRLDRPPPKPRQRGISNDQARELAQLQRAAGVPYSGNGMTAAAAAAAIRDLKRGTRTRPGGLVPPEDR